jgi:hypothetical protein
MALISSISSLLKGLVKEISKEIIKALNLIFLFKLILNI